MVILVDIYKCDKSIYNPSDSKKPTGKEIEKAHSIFFLDKFMNTKNASKKSDKKKSHMKPPTSVNGKYYL